MVLIQGALVTIGALLGLLSGPSSSNVALVPPGHSSRVIVQTQIEPEEQIAGSPRPYDLSTGDAQASANDEAPWLLLSPAIDHGHSRERQLSGVSNISETDEVEQSISYPLSPEPPAQKVVQRPALLPTMHLASPVAESATRSRPCSQLPSADITRKSVPKVTICRPHPLPTKPNWQPDPPPRWTRSSASVDPGLSLAQRISVPQMSSAVSCPSCQSHRVEPPSLLERLTEPGEQPIPMPPSHSRSASDVVSAALQVSR
ncbi:hypothetical protein OBBRIDRAFT_797645 [Obba rivulosa]|uniref:Uncharacterized protein n=1 Tax=Obba rivulosa TaxID=1052685 RepID=A0A8E2DGH0_9APHY|nr:hypothetical protein OBBRIDRAFT_797645 [Obba rivulosa]